VGALPWILKLLKLSKLENSSEFMLGRYCHLNFTAFHFNAAPNPSFHFNADLDPAFLFNADPDPGH
jgi:hypothetical protein